MRRSVTGVLVGVLPVLVLGGCAAQRRDPNCKWVAPVLGAAAGATGGGLGVSEGEPTPSDGEIAAGAAGGAVVGGLIGWALGHWICQEPEPPPPPGNNTDSRAYRPKRDSREDVIAALRELMGLGPNDPTSVPPPVEKKPEEKKAAPVPESEEQQGA